MSGFLAALRHLPDNPILRREWRSLAHELRDWRVWLYLRQPRDARGWAVRALSWCALLPYALWAALKVLPAGVLPPAGGRWYFDLLLLCYALVGFYLCLLATAVMAGSIVRERERETWEALRTTGTSYHDLLLGLLCGRLLPVLGTFLAAGMVWSYARPQYAPLLQRYAPVFASGPQIALLAWEWAFLGSGAGTLALAVSARARRMTAANAWAAASVSFWVGVLLALLVIVPGAPAAAIFLLGNLVMVVASYLSAWNSLRREGA